MTASGERILIADDDPDIRTFLRVALGIGNFDVHVAVDGEDAVAKALELRPSLILMDVMMPRLDGMDAVRRLREDGRTSHIPVIMLTARAQGMDKIEGLASGADDYVTKPFDPEELLARVRATLRRAGEMTGMSPLTGLPGNRRIDLELTSRVQLGQPFALLYADLNNFKAYNDFYGFMRGDAVLRAFAACAVDAGAAHSDPDAFVGHVGGDDFVLATRLHDCQTLAGVLCDGFDDLVPGHYDTEDRERGYIEIADRRGEMRRFPLVSASIGVATNEHVEFTHHSEPVSIATEMKSYAKKTNVGPSNWEVDRRSRGDEQ